MLRQRKEEQMQRELQQLITKAHEAELRDKYKLSEEDIKIKEQGARKTVILFGTPG
jgi:hypothetical protein